MVKEELEYYHPAPLQDSLLLSLYNEWGVAQCWSPSHLLLERMERGDGEEVDGKKIWIQITVGTHGVRGRWMGTYHYRYAWGYGRVGTHGGGSLTSHTPHNLRRDLVIALYLIRSVLFTYVIQ